jgi:hypothetical protein
VYEHSSECPCRQPVPCGRASCEACPQGFTKESCALFDKEGEWT